VPSPRCLAVQIPGFIAGTWAIDPNHSEVSFTVGHLVVSKARGRFDALMPARDNQVRSADFLGVEYFPNITLTSSAVRNEQGHYFIDGDLTIRGDVASDDPIPGRDNVMLLSNEVVLTLDVEAVLRTGANGA
jgi:polyisoprenoid-binding protein YceI